MLQPFLKWADTKKEIAPRILQAIAQASQSQLDQGGSIGRLVEPFAGSCAVALNSAAPRTLLSDLNHDLIDTYRWLQINGMAMIDACQELFSAGEGERYYYECRQRFNHTAHGCYERAQLFVYLNRHGYNGLCHYDDRGNFDVPYGGYGSPRLPVDEMHKFYQWAQSAELLHGDFEAALAHAQPGDVVYCDPPNLPLTTIDGVVPPTDPGFTWDKQLTLAARARALASRGIPVVISSLDTPEARELYADAEVDAFPVRRYLQDKRGARAKVWEIVAIYR